MCVMSVCDCDYKRSLRWWIDSPACLKPVVVKRDKGVMKNGKRRRQP